MIPYHSCRFLSSLSRKICRVALFIHWETFLVTTREFKMPLVVRLSRLREETCINWSSMRGKEGSCVRKRRKRRKGRTMRGREAKCVEPFIFLLFPYTVIPLLSPLPQINPFFSYLLFLRDYSFIIIPILFFCKFNGKGQESTEGEKTRKKGEKKVRKRSMR